jgi:hypothetical protein
MSIILGGDSHNKLLGPGRRCSATNRSGDRCGLPPIVGGFVCSLHGGKAPHVKAAARERLLAMVDPAIDALLRIITSPRGACDTCGRSEDMSTVTRACIAVLDRTGYGPHATLALERVPEPKPTGYEHLTEEELVAVRVLMRRAQEIVAAATARAGIVDVTATEVDR